MLDVSAGFEPEPTRDSEPVAPGSVTPSGATATRLSRTRSTSAHAIILGAAVGILEGTGLMLVAEPSGGATRALAAWVSSVTLAAVGAIPLAFVLLIAAAAAARIRLVSDLWRDLAGGGAPRAIAVWRLLLTIVAAVLFAAVSFHTAQWTYRTYPAREPKLFGFFIAVITTLVGTVVVVVAAVLDRQAVQRSRTLRGRCVQ